MADTNPYDMLVQSDTATNLRLSMMDSVDKLPDVEAKLQGLAKQYGMPVDAVRFQKPEIERKAKLDAFDYDGLAQNYPKTSLTLGKPENAAIAHDDVTVLTALEDAAKYFTSAPDAPRGGLAADVGRVGGSIASAIPNANAGLWGAMAAPFELVGIDSVGGWMRGQQKTAKRMADSWMGLDPKASLVERGVMSGFQSAGQNLLMLPIGLAGSSSAMLSAMGVISGGQSYGKGRDAGLQPAKALALGIEDGVAEVVTEKFMGAAGFLKNVKAGATAGKLFGYEVLKEVPGEIGATVWQNFNSWANINPDKPIADFIQEQPAAIAETIIATLVGGGAQIGAVRGIDRMMRPDQKEQFAQKSEQHAQVLETLQKTAEASKLVARSPDTLNTYMQSLADEGAPNIYLDTAALVAAGVDLNALAQAVPSIAVQLEQVETGGDLVIPTGELLTSTIGSQFSQALIDHSRTDVNGMSRTEAKAYMETQGDTLNAEIERVLAEKENDETFKDSRDVVQARLEGELNTVKRFTPVVNKQYASLAANFYAVMAARAGVTTEQFADTYKLGFTGNTADGGQVLNQTGDINGVVTNSQDVVGNQGGRSASDNQPSVSIDESTGIPLNADGTVTVYHHTSKASADAIRKNGKLKAQAEPDVYVTTQKDTDTGYGDTAVAINIDPALLSLDDEFPSGRKDVRMSVGKPGGEVKVSLANESTTPASGGVLNQTARGQIAFANDITQQASIMSLLKGADLSTFIHESGHFFLEVQADLAGKIAANPNATPSELSILDDMNTTLAWMGVTATPELSALDNWSAMSLDEKRQYHEKFARGFEAYAFEGKAPSLELQKTFQTFRAWLVNVYRALLKSVNAGKTDIAGALDVELNDDVRAVMGRMLATSDQIAEAEAARNMGALFATAEQAGMTAEEYKDYHDLGMQASMDATDALQARGLKDMQWLSRAKSKKLKELQKQHDALRNVITREVRAEVMSQPIYRAWTFLTAKGGDKVKGDKPKGQSKGVNAEVDNLFTAIGKLGGLDRDAVQKAWGIDPKEKLESGVFGAPVVRKTGGMSIDAMAESLMQEGYLLPDENGRADDAKFEELFDDQRRGTDRYSISHDMAAAYGEAPLEVPDLPEMGAGKLRTEDLRYMYGVKDDAIWRTLSERRMTSDESGLHPDVIAEMFEFSSGDELVRKLIDAQPPASVIADMTDSRMLQEYGDLSTPAGLERAADAAIHNEARAKFIATELKMMQAAMSVREGVEGAKHTVDVLKTAAKEYATAAIAKLKLRDIRPHQYAAAEVRAAKAAVKAGSDLEQATLHKRNQLINNYATKIAYAAQDEVKSAVEYFKKFDKVSKAIDPEYSEQIHALLERFDLRAQSNKDIDRTKSLRTWVQARLKDGDIPAISESLLTAEERKIYTAAITTRDESGDLVYMDDNERIKLLADAIDRSAKRSFKDMTVEEVRGLRDTIKQIEHLGRNKDKMMSSRDKRSFIATRDLLVETLTATAKNSGKNVRSSNTKLGQVGEKVARFGVSHIKASTWLQKFDGVKSNGAWFENVLRPANERATFETTRRAETTAELMRIFEPALKGVSVLDKIGKGQEFKDIGTSLNWEERMAFGLNYGNESNLQRLMGGGIAGVTPRLSLEQVHSVLKTLNTAEWTAIQGVWDHFESFRPEISAKAIRVNGVDINYIDPRPFTVISSDGQTINLRGGYAPVKFDRKTSLKAEQHAAAQSAKGAMDAAYSAATTRRSFEKDRVDEVLGQPLMLNLQGVYTGYNDVIHDLAWHEWVIDMNKLLRNPLIDAAIREHYGSNVKAELSKWRDDIVVGSEKLDHGLENAVGWARKFISSASLTYNVISAFIQPLGIFQSTTRIGWGWVGRGLQSYGGDPIGMTNYVQDKSEYMGNRGRTMFRDLNELRNRIAGQTTARELMGRYGYFLTRHFQQMVDIPTWLGAYEKALSEGFEEDTAISLADQSVKDSQGGGEETDQAGIVRGGPLVKLFSGFMDFMITQGNTIYLKGSSNASKSDKFLNIAMITIVVPALAASLRAALVVGDSGEWDDEEKVIKKFITEGLLNLVGMVSFGREFSLAAKSLWGDDKGMQYTGPAGLRIIPDTVSLVKQARQGELDDAFRKSFINVIGDFSGVPSVQINRTITGINALNDGKTTNPAAVITGYQEP